MMDATQFGQKIEALAPPAPFRQTTPLTLEIKKGGGLIAILGLPFFLAGVGMELAAVGVLPTNPSGHDAPRLILALMGIVFGAVGGVMVFGRQWLVLDLSRRSVLRQLGLLFPMRTNARSLGDFNAVVMSHKPGDSDSAETFPVSLRASIGKGVLIHAPLRFSESRAIAEYLARTLRLPLSDVTTDHAMTVDPERAADSLRDRLKAGGMPEMPPRPQTLRCEVEESAGATKIVIPSGGSKILGFVGVTFSIAVFLFVMPMMERLIPRIATAPAFRFAALCLLTLIFGVPALIAAVKLMTAGERRKTTITASSAGLVIEQAQTGKMKTTVIAAGDLLDIDCSTIDGAVASARASMNKMAGYEGRNDRVVVAALKKLVPNTGIIVKSRSGLIQTGQGLSQEEMEYLVWVMKEALTR